MKHLSILALLALFSCSSQSEKSTSTPVADENPVETVEEVVEDTLEGSVTDDSEWEDVACRMVAVGDVETVFEYNDNFAYRLLEDGIVVSQGEVNTERGFESDNNATTYVLTEMPGEYGNFNRIVRFTNGEIKMYDSELNLIEGVDFVKEI